MNKEILGFVLSNKKDTLLNVSNRNYYIYVVLF